MSRYEEEQKYDRGYSAQAHMPASSTRAGAGAGGGNALRLSIPSTPAQASSFGAAHVPANVNVRTSTSSLPPTRVASPRQSASFDEPQSGHVATAATAASSGHPQPPRPPPLLSSPTPVHSHSYSTPQPQSYPQAAQSYPQVTLRPLPGSSPISASALEAQRMRVPMPGPGGRSAQGHRRGSGTGGLGTGSKMGGSTGGSKGMSKLTACFRTAPHPSSIFDLPLPSLMVASTGGSIRLPSFLDASFALLETCLAEGSVRADQLFQSTGPDRVPEQALQELVNFLEEAGEAGTTVQSLAYYGCPAVSAFLLRFLDNIPDPLLTYTRYDQFLKCANMEPEATGPGANAAFKAAFPVCVALAAQASAQGAQGAQGQSQGHAAPALDADDQMLVMQSLLISLPGAHYMLLQRMLQLFRRMLDAAAAASPRARARYALAAPSPSTATSSGLSSPSNSSLSMSLQRLSLQFCSTFLSPPEIPGYNSAASLDTALRKAREQQVLVYLVQNYVELFWRHPVRELHALPPPPQPVDPNEHLVRAVELWRSKAHVTTLKYGRKHFDVKALVRAFRAWKAQSKTNRRRAEAYRQLALLKQELLAERHKNAVLSKELYGLKEEFELRDFADQLRSQSAIAGRGGGYGYGISGATARLNLGPAAAPLPAAAAAGGAGAGITVGAGLGGVAPAPGSASKPAFSVGALRSFSRATSPTSYEEKENALSAALVRDLHSSPSSSLSLLPGAGLGALGVSGSGSGARDLSADLAAVRALQEQDRMLTSTYARINTRG